MRMCTGGNRWSGHVFRRSRRGHCGAVFSQRERRGGRGELGGHAADGTGGGGRRGRPRGSYAQRRPLLAVALAAVLAEYRAQHLGHAVDAQLAPDRQPAEQLHRPGLAQQRVERQRHAGEVLRGAHLVELAAEPQRQLLARVHSHAPVAHTHTHGRASFMRTNRSNQSFRFVLTKTPYPGQLEFFETRVFRDPGSFFFWWGEAKFRCPFRFTRLRK